LLIEDDKKDEDQISEEHKINDKQELIKLISLNNPNNISFKNLEIQNKENNPQTSLNDCKEIKNSDFENNSGTAKNSIKESSTKDKKDGIYSKIYKIIFEFEKSIRVQQENFKIMSQYKNYLRILHKRNTSVEDYISFAFDPINEKLSYYSKNKQIDKNNYLIVTNKI